MKAFSYRSDIDGLRTIAVMPVVLGHAGIPGFAGGFIGVDIFFVISGFLITTILLKEIENQRFSIVAFYERRARRILPALFTVLLACLVAGWFLLLPDALVSLGKSIFATITFASNIWFWVSTGDYFGTSAEMEPLLHTWSLAVEEQFYIVFPLYLWLIARYARKHMFFAVLVPCLASLALAVWATSTHPQANFFLTPTRIWELGTGSLLAISGMPFLMRQGHKDALAGLGLVMILFSIALLGPETPFPGLTAVPAVLGTALIIGTGAVGGNPTMVARLLSVPLVVGIGLISYSLYLWHWPVLVFLRVVHGSIHLPLSSAFMAVGLAIALAWISWRYIERPFRVRGESSFSRGAIFSFSAVGAVSISCLALATLVGKGFESRVDPLLLANYREDIQRSALFETCISKPKFDDLCHLGVAAESETDFDVLIWGDSHAAAMLDGVDAWLTQRGLSGIGAVKSACAPILGVRRVDRGLQHGCDSYNDDVVAFVRQHPEIDTVILVARWALAVEGSRPEGEPGARAVFEVTGAAIAAPGAADNHAAVRLGLTATLSELREMGKTVLVVQGIPEIGFSVPRAVLNMNFLGIEPPEAPDRLAYLARNHRANTLLEEIAGQHGAIVLNVPDMLCDPECRIIEEGRSLYMDDDHLSSFGSRVVVPMLLETTAGKYF